MGSWIKFELVGLKPKTRVWEVRANINDGILLGVVQWHSPWRKYCFFTIADVVFEQDCLRDIAEFIVEETKKHKK